MLLVSRTISDYYPDEYRTFHRRVSSEPPSDKRQQHSSFYNLHLMLSCEAIFYLFIFFLEKLDAKCVKKIVIN